MHNTISSPDKHPASKSYPHYPMSAVLKSTGARFEPFRMDCLQRLRAVLAVEQSAYAHPWSQGNFMDALRSGYQSQLLLAIQNV